MNRLVEAIPLGPVFDGTNLRFNDDRDHWHETEVTTVVNATVVAPFAYLYGRLGGAPLSAAEFSSIPGVR